MHISIPVDQSCEFINVTPVNPLISKCQIKVCWVGETPNRNRSVITKDVARQMANSLPGCPIVGFYNAVEGDFEEHNRTIKISNGKFEISDSTFPYGFVDMHAKVWFQKFLDDGVVEREYLMTEGYIWTGQFPESQRIIDLGNNQSMELDEKTLNATWTKDNNGKPQFFIINEAIISKLCILGENIEPCFEGAQITKVQFALDDEFQTRIYSMAQELKDFLNEGGTSSMPNEETIVETVETVVEEPVVEETVVEEPVVEEPVTEPVVEEPVVEEPTIEEPVVTENVTEDGQTQFNENTENSTSIEEVTVEEPAVNYNLEEIPEYVSLATDYAALQQRCSALEADMNELTNELNTLRGFKAQVDRAAKENMINSFSMLSEIDKADVMANIDTYSLDEIEAKLAVICVRNRVNFAQEEPTNTNTSSVTFNLDSDMSDDNSAPAWIKAVRETQQRL